MAITLDTQPAWTRTAAISSYGGHVDKTNYLSQGAIDALTDVTAADLCRTASDLAAVVRTAPFAVLTFTMDDATPTNPTVHSVYMMTGISSSSYVGGSPPSGFPAVERIGNGAVTVTFSSSYTDEYGTSGAFAVKHATGTAHGAEANMVDVSIGLDTLTLTVRVFDDGGLAELSEKVTVVVW